MIPGPRRKIGPMTQPTFLRLFRAVALCEGLSFLLLLGVAMPLKYVWAMPEAVRWTGSAHGLLFVAYAALATGLFTHLRWPLDRVPGVVFAAVLPFGTFVLERTWLREGEPV